MKPIDSTEDKNCTESVNADKSVDEKAALIQTLQSALTKQQSLNVKLTRLVNYFLIYAVLSVEQILQKSLSMF